MAFVSVGNIIFPKLIHILLESLPTLTGFSPGYHSLQSPHHADLDTPFAVLFDERVSFFLKILFFFTNDFSFPFNIVLNQIIGEK